MRCSKSIASNLVYNPALDLRGNMGSMLTSLVGQGVTEVLASHIYKNFPEGYDFSWKDFGNIMDDFAEKIDGSRGWYTITLPEGDTMTETQPVEEVQTETADPAESTETAETVVEIQVVENSTGQVWLPEQTVQDLHRYQEDAGLKRIALMGAKCFGEFSSRSKSCSGCPLAGSCQVASFAKIATLAAELDAETEKALLPPEPVVEEEVQEEVQEEKADAQKPSLKDGWRLMENTVIASTCSKCEELIPAGSSCINIRGRGNFHMGCAE